ncbi:hypothetical protein [Mesonia sp. HuA40]|nr:hypothetical protein [Mesonia sp. HuA40]
MPSLVLDRLYFGTKLLVDYLLVVDSLIKPKDIEVSYSIVLDLL